MRDMRKKEKEGRRKKEKEKEKEIFSIHVYRYHGIKNFIKIFEFFKSGIWSRDWPLVFVYNIQLYVSTNSMKNENERQCIASYSFHHHHSVYIAVQSSPLCPFNTFTSSFHLSLSSKYIHTEHEICPSVPTPSLSSLYFPK